MYPFRGRGSVKKQKIASIVTIILSLFLIVSSAPFIVRVGGFAIVSTSLGGILLILGLIYFLDTTL